jgi:hypothetical protein
MQSKQRMKETYVEFLDRVLVVEARASVDLTRVARVLDSHTRRERFRHRRIEGVSATAVFLPGGFPDEASGGLDSLYTREHEDTKREERRVRERAKGGIKEEGKGG